MEQGPQGHVGWHSSRSEATDRPSARLAHPTFVWVSEWAFATASSDPPMRAVRREESWLEACAEAPSPSSWRHQHLHLQRPAPQERLRLPLWLRLLRRLAAIRSFWTGVERASDSASGRVGQTPEIGVETRGAAMEIASGSGVRAKALEKEATRRSHVLPRHAPKANATWTAQTATATVTANVTLTATATATATVTADPTATATATATARALATGTATFAATPTADAAANGSVNGIRARELAAGCGPFCEG